MMATAKKRAPRNRSIDLTPSERIRYRERLMRLTDPVNINKLLNRTICQDVFDVIGRLPRHCVDLIFADPPYNLTKSFNQRTFTRRSHAEYADWLDGWMKQIVHLLKPTGSMYICGDWRSSAAIQEVASKYLQVRNRITWEREKGRGAKSNWKNASEDIWFCTVGETFTFNLDPVKLKRRVLAPYTDDNKKPKDWRHDTDGKFRLTHPSNVWTDLTVPFWSMPENTDHPTQKPEKLLARIVLASTCPGDIVLDPFAGSGTTSVVAKKLDRRYIGIEIDEAYCCLAEKRLELAQKDKTIQGYENGVFWERNTPSRIRK